MDSARPLGISSSGIDGWEGERRKGEGGLITIEKGVRCRLVRPITTLGGVGRCPVKGNKKPKKKSKEDVSRNVENSAQKAPRRSCGFSLFLFYVVIIYIGEKECIYASGKSTRVAPPRSCGLRSRVFLCFISGTRYACRTKPFFFFFW